MYFGVRELMRYLMRNLIPFLHARYVLEVTKRLYDLDRKYTIKPIDLPLEQISKNTFITCVKISLENISNISNLFPKNKQ